MLRLILHTVRVIFVALAIGIIGAHFLMHPLSPTMIQVSIGILVIALLMYTFRVEDRLAQ